MHQNTHFATQKFKKKNSGEGALPDLSSYRPREGAPLSIPTTARAASWVKKSKRGRKLQFSDSCKFPTEVMPLNFHKIFFSAQILHYWTKIFRQREFRDS